MGAELLPSDLTLRCPACETDGLRGLDCATCGASYPIVNGRPVLVREDNELFPQAAYASALDGSRRRRIRAPGASVNLSLRRCVERMGEELASRESPRVLVVGAGVQRDELRRLLAPFGDPTLVPVDVDLAADVDAYCDAHELPFADGSFDAAIVTAVLEHVLEPVAVMGEIHRTLRKGGLLYSEVPFMQQVHEGPYDFTRYTLSGHRRLAAGFIESESGATAGPGTALLWSTEHFLLALAGGRGARAIKLVVRTAFAWLKHLDRLIASRPAALDAASCTYFLGRRRDEGRRPDAEIVERYSGAQRRDSRRHLR